MGARDKKGLATAIIDACRAMNSSGLNQGTSGNVSARFGEGFLITPSGVPYDALSPDDIVFVDLEGEPDEGLNPSSEWRMHRDIYGARGEAGAVLHAHPTFCTALACLHRDIPPFHYMVAVAGGRDIRCAPYATFGTPELSKGMLRAMEDRRACLLANHGMICFADGVEGALALGVEVEALARQYCHARQIGEPNLLSDEQMEEVIEKFKTYGARGQADG